MFRARPAHRKNSTACASAGIEPLLFDGETLSDTVRAALAEDDAPDRLDRARRSRRSGACGGPRRASSPARPRLQWIGYLSTVGVYGDHHGAWVDETSECRPVSRRSMLRVAAEQDWLRVRRERGVPVAVLRLSGIYGPGRNAFVNLAKGTARRLVKPGQVFNRIHVADIAGALKPPRERLTGGIFNVTDDEPAPPQDVVAYAAER